MNRLSAVGAHLATAACVQTSPVAAGEGRVIEHRVYYSPTPEKLAALHKRIREHGLALVERQGIENLGHFVPTGDNPENKLVFFLGFASQEAQKEAWAAFLADPEWVACKAASEPDGGLVSKVESSLMSVTDYSPGGPRAPGPHGGVFELRTYTSPAERLHALHARFRDHTMALFDKHSIRNVGYFEPFKVAVGETVILLPPPPPPLACVSIRMERERPQNDSLAINGCFKVMTGVFANEPPAVQDRALGQLVYMVGHESEATAAENWGIPNGGSIPTPKNFLADFLPIMKHSEELAGGKLTLEDGGVLSEFLRATDYSAVQ